MGIWKLFSKRLITAENAGKPDVYKYNEIPIELRRQIIHIWVDAIGPYINPAPYYSVSPPESNKFWMNINKTLCREYGIFQLHEKAGNCSEKCQYFLQESKVEQALDIIELSFRVIDKEIGKLSVFARSQTNITQDPNDAIDELNYRFKEHGVGYQYIDGVIVRIDSQFIHAEIVKPALQLLQLKGFKGAEDEFLKAHEHYRKKRFKEAIAEALKSFESTLKAICNLEKWTVKTNATVQPLIQACIDNGLIPSYINSHFTALKSTLESGLPTVRNKTAGAGHGQGIEPIDIPPYIASYALHLTATNMVFLINSYIEFKKV